MKFGIPENSIEKIKNVFIEFPNIDKLSIFGSRANGNFKEGSDIDLAIFSNSISKDELNSLKISLDELNTPYIFDVLHYESIESKELKEHIDRVGVKIY